MTPNLPGVFWFVLFGGHSLRVWSVHAAALEPWRQRERQPIDNSQGELDEEGSGVWPGTG